MKFSILYEDNHLLVVDKPSGLATMGVPSGGSSLVVLAKEYLKQRYGKPGNAYVGVVSRLDRLASGVIVLAKTSKAASRLSRLFADNDVDKTYWALVSPPPGQREGTAEHWVMKNEGRQRMEIVSPGTPAAQWARLGYRQLGGSPTRESWAWLEINLETGRKHQIRLQLSHLGSPILGDAKYGSRRTFPSGIALHARRLQFEHPVQHVPLDLVASTPPCWDRYTRE